MSHDKNFQKETEATFGHRPKSTFSLKFKFKNIFVKTDHFSDCWGERHTFTLMSFMGLAVSYAIRFTLPIGIVAMVVKGVT